MDEYEINQDKIFLDSLYKRIQESKRKSEILEHLHMIFRDYREGVIYLNERIYNDKLIKRMERDFLRYNDINEALRQLLETKDIKEEALVYIISRHKLYKKRIRQKYIKILDFPQDREDIITRKMKYIKEQNA